MRIISYETKLTSDDSMYFSKMYFSRINLIVGNSATGKTKLLNTIFNGARNVTSLEKFFLGHWDIFFENEGNIYRWTIKTGRPGDQSEEEPQVLEEFISLVKGNEESPIIIRDLLKFVYKNKELPKLSPKQSAISLLQDEPDINPIYKALQSIKRRNFSGSELDFASSFQDVPPILLKKIQRSRDLNVLFSSNLNLNCALYIISVVFKDIYERICNEFISIFPFVSQVKLLDADDYNYNYPGLVPVFSIKEKGSDQWIPSYEFSSGMKKVLLILTDLFSLPGDGKVYLIDEYENSLGINAINFFPSILSDLDQPGQFIITSHHPYLIGNIPVKNWIILHRRGRQVLVKQGEELVDRFSKSKQQSFIQLINDPFYSEGIE
ncbi:MAG: ATP-binding protein [Desulfobacterales bacterium]|nr:ATP-binding protein [Desulfobacterales bacterium]